MFRRMLILSALTLGLLPPGGWADDKAENQGGPTSDADFLVQAISGGTREIKLSELAGGRAGSDEVKAFAQQMVKDHKDANDKLVDHARGMKVAVVAGLEKETRALTERLAGLKGEAFDREYVKAMVDDHEKAVKLFQGEIKISQSGDLKAFAQATLPTLEKHLQHARELHERLGKK